MAASVSGSAKSASTVLGQRCGKAASVGANRVSDASSSSSVDVRPVASTAQAESRTSRYQRLHRQWMGQAYRVLVLLDPHALPSRAAMVSAITSAVAPLKSLDRDFIPMSPAIEIAITLLVRCIFAPSVIAQRNPRFGGDDRDSLRDKLRLMA